MSRTLIGAAALTFASFALPTVAQEVHEGDIEVSVVAGKLTLGPGHLGLPIFEGDFGDVAGGVYSTDDPGFDSQAGTFADGVQVSYQATGSLAFWNGATWSSTNVPAGVAVQLDGNLGEITTWDNGGVSGAASGLIGQAGSDGSIHEHLDWTVTGTGRTTPGAYAVMVSLTGTNLAPSDTFQLVLNRGLDEAGFEASVHALAVPEPSTWALALLGLGAVGLRARRRAAE